jgi:cobalamin-dependent methionine synthase I
MLRQQHPTREGEPNLSLADFIRPQASGVTDRIGVFATTVDLALEHDFLTDDYQRMLAQTLADRLAEATAEVLHMEVRRSLWGYAPDENLSVAELLREDFQGIRPAVGYPSMPDTSINFIIDRLINLKQIGIRLTESGAMKPHASVSGLMFAHPKAHYFELGRIGEDQLRDYAHRRGLPVELIRRFLK